MHAYAVHPSTHPTNNDRWVWLRKRKPHDHWQALPPVPRTVKGNGPKQRPLSSPQMQSPHKIQHDSCYQLAEMGRVSAEMPRPTVTHGDWGGYDAEMLRIASLARTILIRLKYLHICSPVYCLKDRSSCRFFFPWPYQPHQSYDLNTERHVFVLHITSLCTHKHA